MLANQFLVRSSLPGLQTEVILLCFYVVGGGRKRGGEGVSREREKKREGRTETQREREGGKGLSQLIRTLIVLKAPLSRSHRKLITSQRSPSSYHHLGGLGFNIRIWGAPKHVVGRSKK